MEWLPIGSVVRLNDGTRKVMITSRTPLFQEGDKVGYYDYGAYLFPEGQISKDMFYFNAEDIAEVFFHGYRDESEELMQKVLNEQRNKTPYLRLKVKEAFSD